MRTTLAGLFFVLSGLAASPALAGPCEDAEETVYALTAPEYRVDGEPVLGRSAYACGRFWSAANLMEKAAVQRASSLQRFNLAATYAQTGRLEEAQAMYQTVVADGDYVRARTDSSPLRAGEEEVGFGLGEEATRRLAAISRMQSLLMPTRQTASTPGTGLGPQAADQSGTNAVALESRVGPLPAGAAGVNAVSAQAGITDQEALRRDGLGISQ